MSQFAIGQLIRGPQGTYVVQNDDHMIGEYLRNTGTWSWGAFQRLFEMVRPNDTALVVGAHIGTLAIPLSRVCSHVTALEPNPNVIRLFKANVILNDANVEVIEAAASDKEEELEFHATVWNSGQSKRAPKNNHPVFEDPNRQTVSVKAHRLDDLLERFYDVIFMDIEGSEYFALQGMQRHLMTCRMLVSEFFAHHLRDVAGATPEEFVDLVQPHFDTLTVPSLGMTVGKGDMKALLRQLYDADRNEDGIIFHKTR